MTEKVAATTPNQRVERTAAERLGFDTIGFMNIITRLERAVGGGRSLGSLGAESKESNVKGLVM